MNGSIKNLSEYILPNDTPVNNLDATKAFNGLTQQEKLYAHYLSRASYYGGLVVLIQTSPESPQIYRLLQRINRGEKDLETLQKVAVEKAGFSEEDFKAYLVYSSGFFSNMGNYKGFGDTKFIPNFPVEKFESLVKNCSAYDQELESVWTSVKEPLYLLNEKTSQLGLASGGITTYFSGNCDDSDSDLVNKFFKVKNIEGYNNRCIKTVVDGKSHYEIRNAAADPSSSIQNEAFEGATFSVTNGDYNDLLALVNENLEQAVKFVANDTEKNMLVEYIKSFKTGSLDAHKNGSRFWIKNKGPVIESYIGFIETYRDPVGMRGEFEGFVAMVDKEQSAKFQELVEKAEKILTQLPWPKEFEKDTFLRPDFTSLDVLTFGGSGVPAGINIPNYDEIRQSEGFKNVSLGNVISSKLSSKKPTLFINGDDNKLFKEFQAKSFEVQVGLHELLGHGSGKLLQKDESGKFNYNEKELINPEKGKLVEKFYNPGETYDSIFTSLGSSYEECRAECVGLYLCCDNDILRIFGHENETASEIKYMNWLSMCLSGIKGLEAYSTTSKAWKQAHSQARYVILNVLLEAGEGFVTVKEIANSEDSKPDLLLSVDRSKIDSVGKPAIGAFLRKLQVYKSTADIETAKAMYDKYSAVNDEGVCPWAKWRSIVIDRKQPRLILVQSNTKIQDEKMTLVDYEPSPNGMVQSWIERFNDKESKDIDSILSDLYKKDQPLF